MASYVSSVYTDLNVTSQKILPSRNANKSPSVSKRNIQVIKTTPSLRRQQSTSTFPTPEKIHSSSHRDKVLDNEQQQRKVVVKDLNKALRTIHSLRDGIGRSKSVDCLHSSSDNLAPVSSAKIGVLPARPKTGNGFVARQLLRSRCQSAERLSNCNSSQRKSSLEWMSVLKKVSGKDAKMAVSPRELQVVHVKQHPHRTSRRQNLQRHDQKPPKPAPKSGRFRQLGNVNSTDNSDNRVQLYQLYEKVQSRSFKKSSFQTPIYGTEHISSNTDHTKINGELSVDNLKDHQVVTDARIQHKNDTNIPLKYGQVQQENSHISANSNERVFHNVRNSGFESDKNVISENTGDNDGSLHVNIHDLSSDLSTEDIVYESAPVNTPTTPVADALHQQSEDNETPNDSLEPNELSDTSSSEMKRSTDDEGNKSSRSLMSNASLSPFYANAIKDGNNSNHLPLFDSLNNNNTASPRVEKQVMFNEETDSASNITIKINYPTMMKGKSLGLDNSDGRKQHEVSFASSHVLPISCKMSFGNDTDRLHYTGDTRELVTYYQEKDRVQQQQTNSNGSPKNRLSLKSRSRSAPPKNRTVNVASNHSLRVKHGLASSSREEKNNTSEAMVSPRHDDSQPPQHVNLTFMNIHTPLLRRQGSFTQKEIPQTDLDQAAYTCVHLPKHCKQQQQSHTDTNLQLFGRSYVNRP